MRSYSDAVGEYPSPTDRVKPERVIISPDVATQFVRMREDPPRFTPALFDGEWSILDSHPQPGIARLLARVPCRNGSAWDIVRQDSFLFARRL